MCLALKERAIFLAHPHPYRAAAVDAVRLVGGWRCGEIDCFPIVHEPYRRRRAPLSIQTPSGDVNICLSFERGLDLIAKAVGPLGDAHHTEPKGYQQPEHATHDFSCLPRFIASGHLV